MLGVLIDPAVVNLSAYETFFPEKRPFFIEGANIFNIGSIQGGPSYGSQQIFYSRRIGRPPQRFVSGQYVDAPDARPLVKLTVPRLGSTIEKLVFGPSYCVDPNGQPVGAGE